MGAAGWNGGAGNAWSSSGGTQVRSQQSKCCTKRGPCRLRWLVRIGVHDAQSSNRDRGATRHPPLCGPPLVRPDAAQLHARCSLVHLLYDLCGLVDQGGVGGWPAEHRQQGFQARKEPRERRSHCRVWRWAAAAAARAGDLRFAAQPAVRCSHCLNRGLEKCESAGPQA